jgi:hypothetical protein
MWTTKVNFLATIWLAITDASGCRHYSGEMIVSSMPSKWATEVKTSIVRSLSAVPKSGYLKLMNKNRKMLLLLSIRGGGPEENKSNELNDPRNYTGPNRSADRIPLDSPQLPIDRARQVIDAVFAAERDETRLLDDDSDDAARFLLRTVSRVLEDRRQAGNIRTDLQTKPCHGRIDINFSSNCELSEAALLNVTMAAQRHEQHFGNSTVQARGVLDRLYTSAELTEGQRNRMAELAAAKFPVQVPCQPTCVAAVRCH